MYIRSEQSGDEDQIREVHLQAFETVMEANLVDALRDAGIELISLVAVDGEEIIGHILFSPMTIDAPLRIMGLAPMAVLPSRQRQRVGSQLVEAGLKACAQAEFDAVVVLGHPSYYPRFGFEPAAAFGIKSEYDVPSEVFMLKELKPGVLRGISGTVEYHPAFAADEP